MWPAISNYPELTVPFGTQTTAMRQQHLRNSEERTSRDDQEDRLDGTLLDRFDEIISRVPGRNPFRVQLLSFFVGLKPFAGNHKLWKERLKVILIWQAG